MVQIRTPPKISKLLGCRDSGESIVDRDGDNHERRRAYMHLLDVPRGVLNTPHSRVVVWFAGTRLHQQNPVPNGTRWYARVSESTRSFRVG